MVAPRRSSRRQTASSVAPSSPAASSVASPPPARRGGRKRVVVESSDDDEEEEEEEQEEDEEEPEAEAEGEGDSLIDDNDDDESEEEEELPKPAKGNSRKAARPSVADSLIDDEDDDAASAGTLEEEAEVDEVDVDDLLASEAEDVKPLAGPAPAAASAASPPPPPAVPPTPSANRFIPKPPRVTPKSVAAPIPELPKGPQKRLIIEKMVLENFKSYAGRQVIGPFHKSFSAIVGPNGSGKSNTIDALLFVFGFKAKQMRQGKLSELIHNSEDWPDLDYCNVEVWFKEIIDLPGPDAFEVVPNSSLIVARTAYRDNKSKYTINGRTSSYTEATTLLKDRGIDLTHKRFLILQGEVESIAQMKPKAQTEHEEGLLEYLEDIIGTSKYKTAIEEALVQVDALNEVMGEKKGRLGIVVRELNALKGRKKEAEDYLRDQNELARRQSALYQYYLFQLNSNLAIVAQNLERFRAELEAEVASNRGNLAEIEELQASFDEQNAVYQEVKSNTDKIMKELAVQEKKEVQLQEKKKHVAGQQKKLKKAVTEDGHARSSALSWVENHGETVDKTRAELDKLESKLAAEEEQFDQIRDGLKDKTAAFSNQIEVHQKELEPWTAKISERQAAIDVAQSERTLLEKRASGASEAVTEAEQALESLAAGGHEKEEYLQELQEEKIALQKQLVSSERSLASLAAKESTVRQQASGLRDRVEDAKASLAAGKGDDAMLSGLKKLQEMGRLDGFYGRLGDLGVIDDKYDVAVTTACGGSLNALVTDTIEQGQAVIEHLRRTGGRASIFVLTKLGNKDLGPRDTPEGVPRLFDLIKPKDARLGPAFFKAVGQTLVAKDLEQANRIAYGKQRWRVVTLSGELIDTSGAMSGGGTRVQRGGMSSKFASDRVEPQVIARYEKESEAAQQDLRSFLAEKAAAEQAVAEIRQRIPEVELAITKIELDVKNGRKRVAEAEKRLRELQSQNKPDADDEKRIRSLDKEIAAHTKEVQTLRQKSSGIEDAIKALQDQILEVGGVKLRAQKSKVDGIKQQIELSSEKVTKAEVEQAKSAKEAEKLAKAIQTNTAKLEDLDEQLEELDAQLAVCVEDMRLVRATVDEARDGMESLEEELSAVKEELDEKSGALNAFKARELDLKQKIDDNAKTLKDSQNRHAHWTDRHAELELQYVDEDDDEESPKEAASDRPPAGDMDVDKSAADPRIEDPEAGAKVPAPAPKPRSANQELEIFSDDELEELDVNILKADVANLEERVLKSKPNMSVLQEFRRRQAEFDDRQADLDKVTAERDAGKTRYDDLRQTRHFEFMAGFNAISSKLKEMYQLITLGGLAELELVDSLDPFSEGIIFSVMPPKKSWKNISNLSGGEKTLSSLALVFALHVYKPTPLYFMDEIDAALDFRNVSIIANYIRERTKSAQFIIISLRSDMFELSHRLVGIYKTSNATKSVAIDNGQLIPAK